MVAAWIFIGEHLVEILFSLIATGALALCKHFWSQNKKYKALEEKEKERKLDEHIDEKLKDIEDEIEQLRKYIRTANLKDHHDIQLIVSSYKFRLIQLCKLYLHQGYLTEDQYEQINVFYQLYHELGGNGEAEHYYNKVQELPIKPEEK